MSNDNPTTIFDEFFKESVDSNTTETSIIEEASLPKKCLTCLTANICSPISTFVQLIKIGIVVDVQSCPYYKDIRKVKSTGTTR